MSVRRRATAGCGGGVQRRENTLRIWPVNREVNTAEVPRAFCLEFYRLRRIITGKGAEREIEGDNFYIPRAKKIPNI